MKTLSLPTPLVARQLFAGLAKRVTERVKAGQMQERVGSHDFHACLKREGFNPPEWIDFAAWLKSAGINTLARKLKKQGYWIA